MEMVGTVIYIAIAVVLLYGALRGAHKGLYKSLIDLGVTIVVAFLSVWIAKTVSKTLVDEASLMEFLDWASAQAPNLAETLASFKEIIVDFSSDTNLVGMILSLPAIILSPFIFMILYLVIGVILKIPKMIIARSIFGKNTGETYHGGSRIVGAVVGGVVRVLSLAIFLIPLIGYINLTNDTLIDISQPNGSEIVEEVEPLEAEGEADNETAKTLDEISTTCGELQSAYIAPIADNFALKAIHACGGNWVFKTLSSAKVEKHKISLTTEIDVLVSVYNEAKPLITTPIEQFDDPQATAIKNITNTLDNAIILPSITSGIISHVSSAGLEGEEVFGYAKINVGEYYEPTLDEILSLFAETTEATIKQDIHTVGNLVTICIEEDFFKEVLGGGEALNVAKNEEFLGKVFAEIYKNDTTRPLVENMINALKNYIYRVYNEVNETNIPLPEQLVMDNITEQNMYDEGALIAKIVVDFMKFYETFDMNEEDNTKLLIQTDVRSLGRALDNLKKSIIIGDSYNFLLKAILKSEGASKLQFLTPEFIELLTTTDTSMEVVLVSRQQIAVILSAAKGQDREEAIKHLLENVDPETAAVIVETLTPEILWNFGMDMEKSEAMSGVISSIVQEMASNDKELTHEELENEIEAVDKLVSTIQGATDGTSTSENIFSTTEGEDSATGMTSSELVETIVNSTIVSSAINSATTDENGDLVEDPYKISNKLSETDKTSAKDAIESYYTENAVDGDNAELEKTLGSLATILGVEITLTK